MKNSISKKVEYLRISANADCNLKCEYCHNEGEHKKHGQLKKNEVLLFSKLLFDMGSKKIKFIGGEPTLRKDLPEIISIMRSWSSSLDISVITNGVWSEKIIDNYLQSGVSRINVSLHSPFRLSTIRDLVGEKRNSKDLAMTNALHLKAVNLLSKVNFVLLKNVNEQDFLEVISWAGKYSLTVDVLNMLYSQNTDRKDWQYHYTFDEIEKLINKTFIIEYVEDVIPPIGLPIRRYFLDNSAIINLKVSQLKNYKPYRSCANCPVIEWCIEGISAIRITVDGKIKPCLLRSDNTFNLRDAYYIKGNKKAEEDLLEYLAQL